MTADLNIIPQNSEQFIESKEEHGCAFTNTVKTNVNM